MTNYHIPILVDIVTTGLKVKPGKQYIDATVGDGGHAEAILKIGGKVLGLDRDPDQIARSRERLEKYVATGQLRLVQSNFSLMSDVVNHYKYHPINGILFDLGISSFHLDSSTRGFSFRTNQPLDMRLNPGFGATAADLVNALSENELTHLFVTYGQVRPARVVAREIVKSRRGHKILTTKDLVDVIDRVAKRTGKLHPATKIFMSLRIAVNDEVHSLGDSLSQAITLLFPGGMLAVITFHEGEDRIVKHLFRSSPDVVAVTKRPLVPTAQEVMRNPRSRSAKLRIAEKLSRELP